MSTLSKGYVVSEAFIGGLVGDRKAVYIENQKIKLPPFSEKDWFSLDIAKNYGIKHFTLSFMESPLEVNNFRDNYPGAIVYSKIESKAGLNNFIEIANLSEGILIDRGDLSHQIPLEKIPFIQKYVIEKVRSMGKEIFIATNTLEQMAHNLKPNRSEVNDIVNTIIDGATGIALTRETAVGRYPVDVVDMLKALFNEINSLGITYGDVNKEITKKMKEKEYLKKIY